MIPNSLIDGGSLFQNIDLDTPIKSISLSKIAAAVTQSVVRLACGKMGVRFPVVPALLNASIDDHNTRMSHLREPVRLTPIAERLAVELLIHVPVFAT